MSKKKKENYLEYIPEINKEHEWSVDEDIVTVNYINKGFYNKLAQKIFKSPRVSHIELDKFGSYIWQQIDGEKNILEISELVKIEFGKKVEPLYERICTYFNTLSNENFIDLKNRG